MAKNFAGEVTTATTAAGSAPQRPTVLAATAETLDSSSPPLRRILAPVVGRLVRCGPSGTLVDFADNPFGCPVTARTTTTLDPSAIGGEVVLVFEAGDPARPIVVGVVRPVDAPPSVPAEVDGERVLITADREIVLRCGEASITLTRAGKVLIRGTYVLSRSSGANRIKGAVVEIN
jgi:hypothetical protein